MSVSQVTTSRTPGKDAAPRRRSELASFLRSRRERLDPELLGLPTGTRRRTPGRSGRREIWMDSQAGRFSSGLASFDKVIPGGETATLRTRLRHLDFVAVVPKDDGDFVLIDIGTLNTRTGKVVLESLDEFRNPSARRTTVTMPWRMR